MCAFFKTSLFRETSKVLLAGLVISSAAIGRADQPSLLPVPPSNQDPNWILGPAKADLGDFAKIEVPEGYRFTDGRGARILLQRMKNPVPRNVVGLLTPDSGKWWVVLDYADVGYLKGLGKDSKIDSALVMRGVRRRLEMENAMRMQQGGTPIAAVDWAMQPVLDGSRYTLEWALRAETRSEKIVNLVEETETNNVVNHTLRLIGKDRMLGLTAVQSDQMSSERIPLKELGRNITFNPGQRYTDYKPGDQLAKNTLEELIMGEDTAEPAPPYLWPSIYAGCGVVAIGLVALAIWIVRRVLKRQKMSRAYPDYEEHWHTFSPMFKNGKGGARNGARRRREFNYQKFYSDMMLEVSSGPFVASPAANGKQTAVRSQVRSAPVEPNVNQTIVRANLELIANQTHLIEEQKRLLQEQGRLIHEKSKLIEEKTKLLEQQAELFERDLL